MPSERRCCRLRRNDVRANRRPRAGSMAGRVAAGVASWRISGTAPAARGGQRPLGIPCISDRVVEMAALLTLGPIFEADLLRNQYGFRPGMDAKMAVRQAFWHVSDRGRSEVADTDLSDYFSSIPHGPLLRCVSRRVADGTLLSVIKRWLTAPVIERDKHTTRCTTEAKDRHRGTPPGSPISPL